MKKTFTRSASLLLAGALSLGLAACAPGSAVTTAGTSGTSAVSTKETEKKEAGSSASGAAGKTAEIELFTRFSDGASKDFFDQCAKDYMAKHSDVKITVSSANNQNYKQEINVRLSSNKTPDIYFAWSGIYAENFVRGQQALDLSSYISADKAWSDQIIANQFGPFTFNGKIYGLPIIMDGKTFYYNEDIFQELGLELPKDWDSFMRVLEKLKASKYIPISLGNIEDWATGHYMTTLNQRVVDPAVLKKDYALEGDFSDPGYVKALEYLMKLTPYFTPDFNSVTYDTGISDFVSGKAAIYYEQFNQVQYIAPATFKWSWFDFPAISDGKGDQHALTGAPQGFMVSAKTPYPDVCVDFLKYMTSPEVAAKMVKDTKMISTVKGAINTNSAEAYFIKIADTIMAASSVNLWLDNAMNSEVALAYLSAIQAMVGDAMTPAEVMTTVQKKVAEVK